MERRNLVAVANLDSPERGSPYWREWTPKDGETNDSMWKLFSFVEPGSKVLDIGCAIGQLGAALKNEKGCTVYGVEMDEPSARIAESRMDRVICADAQGLDFEPVFGGERFDYIVFGDVLEHMADPEAVLAKTQKVLAPEGAIVLSVPNVAHAAVRLSLLSGSFDYVDAGLLDRTHLRFFTRKSLEDLLERAGLVPVELERTVLPATGTEIRLEMNGLVTPALIEAAESEPEGTSYQFVVKAVPLAHGKHKRLVTKRIVDLEERFSQAAARSQRLEKEIASARTQAERLEETEKALEEARSRLAAIELEQRRMERLVSDRLRSDAEISKLLQSLSDRLTACETSSGTPALAKLRGELEEALLYVSRACDRRISETHALAQHSEATTRALMDRIGRYINIAPLRLVRKIRRKLRGLPPAY